MVQTVGKGRNGDMKIAISSHSAFDDGVLEYLHHPRPALSQPIMRGDRAIWSVDASPRSIQMKPALRSWPGPRDCVGLVGDLTLN